MKTNDHQITQETSEGLEPEVQIVDLMPDDWRELRDLKLHSLEAEPVAFEDPQEGRKRYAARTEAEWRAIISGAISGGRSGKSVHVFAKVSDKVVGMVSVIIPEQTGAMRARVQHMYVNPEYRGRKIGKRLFDALLSKAKRRNISVLALEVIATQIPAVEMYKSFGFTEVRRQTVQRGGMDYEEILMELHFH